VRKSMMWVAASATGVLLSMTGSALAAGNGEQVGENLGELLGSWAKNLYLGIAALVALVFLLNRRFADLAIFMVAAVVVGGFVVAPNEIASTVRGIWDTLTAA
jgi:hypothetical protein